MNAKELIEALQSFHPDMEIYSYTDHGQTPEKAMLPGIIYLAPNGDFDEYSFDLEDAEEYGYTKQAIVL